jgi:hypothetical protein
MVEVCSARARAVLSSAARTNPDPRLVVKSVRVRTEHGAVALLERRLHWHAKEASVLWFLLPRVGRARRRRPMNGAAALSSNAIRASRRSSPAPGSDSQDNAPFLAEVSWSDSVREAMESVWYPVRYVIRFARPCSSSKSRRGCSR